MRGFTLAELLISLGILGVISVFTIPKIVLSIGNNEIKRNFKVAYTALYGAHYQAWVKREYTTTTGEYFTLLPKFNYLRSALDVGPDLWPPPYDGGVATYGGVMLHNGTVLALPDAGACGSGNCNIRTFYLDANGPELPNTDGQDRFLFRFNVGTQVVNYGGRDYKPGEIYCTNLPNNCAAMFQ